MKLSDLKRLLRRVPGRFVRKIPSLAERLQLPRGFYWDADEFQRGEAGRATVRVPAFGAEIFTIPKASFISGPSSAVENGAEAAESAPAEYYEIPGARLLREPSCVLTPDLRLLCSVSQWFSDDPNEHWLFDKIRFPKLKKVAGKVMVWGGEANYFHCLYDSMQKMAILEKAGVKMSEFDYFVASEPRTSFERQIYALCGIPEERLLPWEQWPYLEAETLAFTSGPWRPGRWAADFARRLIPPTGTGAKRRVYISRKNAGYRRVLNEERVLEVLLAFGFEAVSLERLSVVEQAAFFRQVDVVVSAHGAGLTNLIFAEPGTRVLEIRVDGHRDHNWGVFRRMTAQLQMDYACILTPTSTEQIRPERQDLEVPIDAIEQYCKSLVSSRS